MRTPLGCSGILAICLLAAALCPAPGCGRSDGAAAGTDAVVELAVLMEPDATGVWRELFAEFNRLNPDIRVRHVEGPSATDTREDLYVTAFLSGDTPYDLIYADVVWVPKMAAAGWLEDLTDRWPDAQWQRFIPGSLQGGTYRGRIYRVPTQMNGGLLFYRKDLLEAAGEQPPATYDDLVRIARQLQKTDELWGFVWQGKQYEGLVCDYLEVLTGHGGTWIDPDTGEVGLDRPEAVAAVRFLRGCVGQWGISPPGVTTYQENESATLFLAGRAVFHRNWPYVWTVSQKPDAAVNGKVGMVPMPATAGGRRASTLGGWGFAIAKTSPRKEAAWRFVQWISADEQVRAIHDRTGMELAIRSFYEQSDEPAIKALYEALKTAVPRPALPQYAQASDILQRHLSAALTGRVTEQEAMARAAKETRLLLGRR